ncbi:ATP-dependent DNA helicase [Agreia sp. Leaf244]|uniref:ATP-dependent DNA helicase n=1 Tax=Agreia sp. Leaf244 TaxID=1736305 RepID=UPI0006FA256D|nr:ATP-dependent DNA helicase [Agreia sp. Leaf244]KQO04860.1 ATP-dependent DNA helicase [Agreia sp. Leaf244]
MIGAFELADALGMPRPTDEQRAVIEAPLVPSLVIAGAGSGKTATMANRVVWLLANGLVQVNEVLGLTFTRKAAGELDARISGHIDALRRAGLLPASAARETGLDGAADSRDLFDRPTVSTYNSFGNSIFRDNALLVGREPESVLLGENAAWGLARRVLRAEGDDRLVPLAKSLDQLVDAVLSLSSELSENVVDSAGVAGLAEQFGYLVDLPYTEGKAKSSPYASVASAVEPISALPLLIDLAGAYARQKQAKGLVEFSDQVALALEICMRHPQVIEQYRSRFAVVLLDEYQDTSVVQTRLLASLFAGHGVMAVGDPHQSIYGWRGASASNLGWFGKDFGSGTVPTYSLSTSWRNSRAVLDAANTLVEPLRAESPVDVHRLEPRPQAPAGSVEYRFLDTRDEEADAVADWLAQRFVDHAAAHPDGTVEPLSAAMLFRVRSHMDFFAAALDRRGIPFHILGVGGLLSAPEVVDVISALRATHDPSAGSSLIRLLSGARWNIGVRDLKALAELAGWLATRDSFTRPVSPDVTRSMRESVAPDDSASIVDALDFVAEHPSSHPQLERFSENGLERLRHAGSTLATFRSRGNLPLLDFVRFVEQQLLLDVELAANERVNSRGGSSRGALDALHDEIASFLAGDDDGTLGSFLAWLDRAEKRDDLSPRTDEPEPGTVQLLTIHGSKGLEWDVVAVPRLVADEIPAQSKEGKGWLRFGVLPYEFRGDASSLPVLDWRGLGSQQVFDGAVKTFQAELAAKHLAEERRLIYVAVTRARTSLLLTGSFWATQSKPRRASTFLAELSRADVIGDLPEYSAHETNPLDTDGVTERWPLDPLGARRGRVEQAADLVSARIQSPQPLSAGRWQRDLDLLLAERDREAEAAGVAPVPDRIAASRFKDYVTDPQAVARALRRPMPERPFRQTRLGTRFHAWVEHRYGMAGGAELIDATTDESDSATDELPLEQSRLEALQATFEASEWANKRPLEVELEIHLVLGRQVVVCKIDAIFTDGDRYQVVDWKTGKAPTTPDDLEVKQLQLALYRLAYAQWKGIDPQLIDAVFYFVADDTVIAPERLFSEQELLELWPF